MRDFLNVLRRSAYIMALAACAVTAYAQKTPEDASTLFRDETIDAPTKLKWRGPDLSEETRFAVAASGLSWQPLWGATPLFHRDKKGLTYSDAAARESSFTYARRSDAPKEAFAFGLSVVLAPAGDNAMGWSVAFEHLSRYGDDFDKALIGILHAPDRLPFLPTLQYSAAEVLVRRASARLLPFFLTLADSEDAFLRSRAITALGIIGFQSRGPGMDMVESLGLPLRELGISARQQAMISDALRRAAEDRSYLVRAAAAFALGLAGNEEDLPILEKLAKDPAYIIVGAGPTDSRDHIFPVRLQAEQSLRRLMRMTPVITVFRGKAPRGTRDVTNDQAGLRKDQARVMIRPVQW